jgi:hypothetical protein
MTEDLFNLLVLDIPEKEKNSVGFLEIIKKQYNETINSAIYAHFVNSDEKQVSELFLNSLVELIDEKTGRVFSFGKAFATCEVVTNNGRIDIVIQDELSSQVIIIENKIFHWLNNDLIDYWEHYKVSDDEKVGIVLTPFPQEIPKEVEHLFINITHSEWIQKVKAYGLPYGVSNKYVVYISDFVQTIESYSKSYKMNDQAKFYFNHASKIIKVQETVHSAYQFLNDQFQLIADKLGWQVYGNSMEYRNFWDEELHLDTYLTISTSALIKGEMKILLILELNGKDRDKHQDVEALLKDNEQFKRMNKTGKRTSKYIHLGFHEYLITHNDLENFANFVSQKIVDDFSDATLKTIHYLYPDIDISNWEKNLLKQKISSSK